MSYVFERATSKAVRTVLQTKYLTSEDSARIAMIEKNWRFYEGYHWDNIPEDDSPQVTKNYCRPFVDKFVSFELGKGFNINMDSRIEDNKNERGANIGPKVFLEDVWRENGKLLLCRELGLQKALEGDAWVHVAFEKKSGNTNFEDPFGIYDKGRIRIHILPGTAVFPEFEKGSDKNKLIRLTIMFIKDAEVDRFLLPGKKRREVVYRQVWTKDRFQEWEGDDLKTDLINKYGVIPFRQIKNVPVVGSPWGQDDITDLIPLNIELNIKTSNVSEVIDYHSAPVTLVFGARVGQLERGANKIWGGLPKDGRVENLELKGDLAAANGYIEEMKKAMHEIGKIPVGALGGELKISNTSGVALQIALNPLLERIQDKQNSTKEGLEYINQLILLIAEKEKLITIPEGTDRRLFFWNEVSFESMLPKNVLEELQMIQSEMALGLTDRESAMERLGKENIAEMIKKADADRKENPELYGINPQTGNAEKKIGNNADGSRRQVNSGLTNGPEPK